MDIYEMSLRFLVDNTWSPNRNPLAVLLVTEGERKDVRWIPKKALRFRALTNVRLIKTDETAPRIIGEAFPIEDAGKVRKA